MDSFIVTISIHVETAMKKVLVPTLSQLVPVSYTHLTLPTKVNV